MSCWVEETEVTTSLHEVVVVDVVDVGTSETFRATHRFRLRNQSITEILQVLTITITMI